MPMVCQSGGGSETGSIALLAASGRLDPNKMDFGSNIFWNFSSEFHGYVALFFKPCGRKSSAVYPFRPFSALGPPGSAKSKKMALVPLKGLGCGGHVGSCVAILNQENATEMATDVYVYV